MRFFRSAVFAMFALVLAAGVTLPAVATVARVRTPHPRARRLAAAASHRSVSRRASRAVAFRRTPRGHRAAAMLAAHRHPVMVSPTEREISASIPPVPPKRWMILPALVGSHESLVRQNQKTEADGLERIEDDAQLDELRRGKALVAVPVSAQLHINEELPMNRRYCRPWTAEFLINLARAHAARFRRSLIVTSAVRTVEYQRSLMRVNGNAAPADGDIASPHLSGATIDIAKKGLSMSEVSWMRAYLLPLEQAGKIDVEEEFYQSCFHITVYKSYSRAPGSRIASTLLAERLK